MNGPIMLVNVNTLERFVPSSNKGISGEVVIYGVRFHQATPEVIAKVACSVRRLLEAVKRGEEKDQVYQAFRVKMEEIWNWGIAYWGEEKMREAVERERSKKNVQP